MENTTSLPKMNDFYSSLSESKIAKKDHVFAKKMWKKFQCKNLIDYTELYCTLDVYILAEIFEKFRQDMMSFSNLDPARYISLPAFAFDSMLKITKSWIELPTDINMVHFIEKGIRGGVSFINTRMLTSFDEDETQIFYIDANVSSLKKFVDVIYSLKCLKTTF
jgi:hypothetical protein